ncbi:MAG TPA: hypothetical protein VJ697_11050 [Nitrososphaeraceae archaeon]|nr:hypothetical protein [Nitrososphaeraceae archaeon]
MNMAIFISILSLFSLVYSVNMVFLNNPYAVLSQDVYGLSSDAINETFTESEPKIPISAEDNEETSIISDNETSKEAQSLQNQTPFIENAMKSKAENKSSSNTTSS